MIDGLDDSTSVTAAIRGSVDEVLAPGPLQLVVLGGSDVRSHPLPAAGTVTIGRSRTCDVRIDVDSVSRKHAIVHLGESVEIEDLGSANGTRVRGEQVTPNGRMRVAVGDVVQVGTVQVMVQERVSSGRPRRLWSHDYFEARVEDECGRIARSGGGFFLLRVVAAADAQSSLVQECLADLLRAGDIIGTYGPTEYDVLLCDTPVERADEVARRIKRSLDRQRITCQIRTASCPRDGRTAHALIARLAGSAEERSPGQAIIVEPVMRSLYAMIDRVATSDLGILLLGETGVGKDVFAETVHRASARKGQLVAINCAALSDSLLESELFGHEKGAFTSAVADKVGLLESAEGGTVLLDEVGEMPLPTQAKLLRVIEDRQLRRVGGVKSRKLDVRFVAATNRDLERDVERGTFRRDLYFRLNGVTVVIPPLRERRAEIEPLARRFAARAADHAGQPVPDFTPETLVLLAGYSWPGNIRELRNVVERAVILSGGGPIRPEHLPIERMRETIVTRGRTPSTPPPLHPARRSDDERERILAALERANGNQTLAAKMLNVSRRTLINRLNEFGLPRPRKDRS